MTPILSLNIKRLLIVLITIFSFSCNQEKKSKEVPLHVLWKPYNDSSEVSENSEHEKVKMRYKFIQSKVLDKNEVFQPLYEEVSQFSEVKYEMMKPLVLEQDIPTLQSHVSKGKFSYVELTQFYLYRIYKYELPNETTLNSIIALNPHVIEEARQLDKNSDGQHAIYGMPILLKDNIGALNMNTTAGAIALMENKTDDAFIVKKLKEKGALILGKANLSEWANYLCSCPNGQSAVGGQTLNPYGRRVFDTGGSSAGSGATTAANYAVAAIGTETSGSILSPSGQSSVVGLKPTIGVLSRTGIVPISSTLDTPGPMTKNVIDNAILFDAMRGRDMKDSKSIHSEWPTNWYHSFSLTFENKKLGVIKKYLENDSIYNATVKKLESAGVSIIAFDPPDVSFDGFLSILNIDMKYDLPNYIFEEVKNLEDTSLKDIQDIVDFNLNDSLVRIPYGQIRFEGILNDSTTLEELHIIKKRLKNNGRHFFDKAIDEYGLDAVLSINNYDAGAAAIAEYPALTVPMGYKKSGEPVNLTFIAKQYEEAKLYELGAAFEALSRVRIIPDSYKD
ncbi:amidase family protein [Croceitalea sp. P059]|uniref:amidase family protein n=1 Tax=Croceitalea sp. P059 TaxID=3075601 RepID=UPI00288660AA|nr:amidase family protein [Croceitalea sp. P059]MDT0540272.1 amidase family protein [Croceitalea sp. P059]